MALVVSTGKDIVFSNEVVYLVNSVFEGRDIVCGDGFVLSNLLVKFQVEVVCSEILSIGFSSGLS